VAGSCEYSNESSGSIKGVFFFGGGGNFYLQHRIQNGTGAHGATNPMGTEGSFPGGKAAGACS
jgi:hypothetical protein